MSSFSDTHSQQMQSDPVLKVTERNPLLEVRCLSHVYSSNTKKSSTQGPAIEDVSFQVLPGAVCCLLGPSGCGKSTILRLIAGLEKAQKGAIVLEGQVVSGPGAFLEPDKRCVGFVFQDLALFPHLTVSENVGFGLSSSSFRNSKPGAVQQAKERVARLLEKIGLAHRSLAYPAELSGGEQQRVALARSLATEPKLLLLDEPFSSLDSVLRRKLRKETRDLLKQTNTPAVLVTHDPEEALEMADHIVLLHQGRVVQQGTPRQLFEEPSSPFVVSFFGPSNDWKLTPLLLAKLAESSLLGQQTNSISNLCLRPSDVVLVPDLSLDTWFGNARIQSIRFQGCSQWVELSSETWGTFFGAVSSSQPLNEGQTVSVNWSRGFRF